MVPQKSIKPALKTGLFGTGLHTYWEQFAGLEQKLAGYGSIRNFVEQLNTQGLVHYCDIYTGHITSKIIKPGQLPGVQTVKIC